MIAVADLNAGMRRTVQAIPLFGSATTNAIVLGLTIVLVIVGICIVSGAPADASRGAKMRAGLRCVVYSLPFTYFFLYLFGGTVAAELESQYATPMDQVFTTRVDPGKATRVETGRLWNQAPPAGPEPTAPPPMLQGDDVPGASGGSEAHAPVAQTLTELEARLGRV